MAVGMQKVRQQAMCTSTDLATDALDTHQVGLACRARPPHVRAPADQATGSAALGMRTSIGESKGSSWKGNGGDVLFDGAREVMYNDHALGTPPPRGQASQLGATAGGVVLSTSDGAIIHTSATPVKPGCSCSSLSASFRLLNQCGCLDSALHLIPAPDHSI
jgi:hypothetical protein